MSVLEKLQIKGMVELIGQYCIFNKAGNVYGVHWEELAEKIIQMINEAKKENTDIRI